MACFNEQGTLVLQYWNDVAAYTRGHSAGEREIEVTRGAPATGSGLQRGHYGNTYGSDAGETYDPITETVTVWSEAEEMTGEGGFGDSCFTKTRHDVRCVYRVDWDKCALIEMLD